jgi:uncharacterized protein
MKPKVSIVTLGVRDFAKSLAFYRDGLGFTPNNYKDGEEHVIFKMEGSWLSLYPRHLLADDATVPDDGRGFSGVTLAHNVKSKAYADAVFAQAVAAGARAVKTPQDVFWGGYSGYFADPDGHLWEVAWNPFTDLT